jgi:hypothetical protein
MTTATKIKQLRGVPRSGEVILSVNLGAIANPNTLWEFAVSLGLSPEICWLKLRDSNEIHLLLIQETHAGEIPMDRYEAITDALEDFGIDFDAIRHARGGRHLPEAILA